MISQVQLARPSGNEAFALTGQQFVIGRYQQNDLVIAEDPTVSRLHAVIERIGGTWCLRDLGSTNGTILNGRVLDTQVPLHSGDEIRLGHVRLVVHLDNSVDDLERTENPAPPPYITARELVVLRHLLQPAANGDILSDLASPREIAATLGVSEAAVRQHFLNLYQKFDIDTAGHRLSRLANEALRRGAINLVDLRTSRTRARRDLING